MIQKPNLEPIFNVYVRFSKGSLQLEVLNYPNLLILILGLNQEFNSVINP
jgi:hypothetical protein